MKCRMYTKVFIIWLLFCVRISWSDQWALSQMLQLPVKHRVMCSLLMYSQKSSWIGKYVLIYIMLNLLISMPVYVCQIPRRLHLVCIKHCCLSCRVAVSTFTCCIYWIANNFSWYHVRHRKFCSQVAQKKSQNGKPSFLHILYTYPDLGRVSWKLKLKLTSS